MPAPDRANESVIESNSVMGQYLEKPLVFECQDHSLYGILHSPLTDSRVGILIVVGGPQYRVGSHRQFLLLARDLADAGYPVLRFDYSGMGDSDGPQKTFDHVDADIRAAIDQFIEAQQSLEHIVIWGLCDAASAALFYAYQDNRVKSLVLLNPWVYTQEGKAKAYLKYYYINRVLSREFWSKLMSGKFRFVDSIRSLLSMVVQTLGSGKQLESSVSSEGGSLVSAELPLPERMKQCLARFNGPVLCILSGHNDMTAQEFKDLLSIDQEWQQIFKSQRILRRDFPESDHTFSRAEWRNQVADWTLSWINDLLTGKLPNV